MRQAIRELFVGVAVSVLLAPHPVAAQATTSTAVFSGVDEGPNGNAFYLGAISVLVGVMPWIMLVIMFAFQPATMKEFYFSPLGFFTLVFCTIWISIGMKVVNKLGDISV